MTNKQLDVSLAEKGINTGSTDKIDELSFNSTDDVKLVATKTAASPVVTSVQQAHIS